MSKVASQWRNGPCGVSPSPADDPHVSDPRANVVRLRQCARVTEQRGSSWEFLHTDSHRAAGSRVSTWAPARYRVKRDSVIIRRRSGHCIPRRLPASFPKVPPGAKNAAAIPALRAMAGTSHRRLPDAWRGFPGGIRHLLGGPDRHHCGLCGGGGSSILPQEVVTGLSQSVGACLGQPPELHAQPQSRPR